MSAVYACPIPKVSPSIIYTIMSSCTKHVSCNAYAMNSQFRLVLSVTPCMSRTSSLESVNRNTSLLLFSSTSSPTYVPTSDSPKDQLPPSPSSSTNSLTSFHTCKTSSQHDACQALSPELFSPTPTSSTYVHNSEQVAITPPPPPPPPPLPQ